MEYSPLRKHSESFWESRETLWGLRPRMPMTVCLHLPWRISSACTKGYLNKGIQLPLPFCILYIKWSIAPLGHRKIHVYMSELFFSWFDSRMLEGFTYCVSFQEAVDIEKWITLAHFITQWSQTYYILKYYIRLHAIWCCSLKIFVWLFFVLCV